MLTRAESEEGERAPASLVCPDCRVELLQQAESLACPQCKTSSPIRAGAACFVKEEPPYWGEVTLERMRFYLGQAEQQGWREALLKLERDEPAQWKRLRTKLTEGSIANWTWHLTLPAGSLALDVGAGLGTMSSALARRGFRVSAAERVRERAQFIALRTAQDKTGIRAVQADVFGLPFAPGSFDLVVINGVLEWIALSDMSSPPRAVQLRMLRTCLDLLRPGGYLYLGIENRFAFAQFFGDNPHGDPGLTTVLPRPLADLWSRAAGKGPYRTWIHSFRGYRRLLEDAGFHQVRGLSPRPNYNRHYYLLPMRDRHIEAYYYRRLRGRGQSGLAGLLARGLHETLIATGLSSFLMSSFVIFGRRP